MLEMIQSRRHAGLALEPRQAIGVTREGFRKKFNGDTPTELGVGGLIDVAPAPRTQVARDLVVCEVSTNHGVTEICGRIL